MIPPSSSTLTELAKKKSLRRQAGITVLHTYGMVFCLNATNGNKIWNASLGPTEIQWSTPAVDDLDGDGKKEIVVGTVNRSTSGVSGVYCLSSAGSLKWKYRTDYQIECAATIANLYGYNKKKVLIGTDNDTLYCLNGAGTLNWSRHGSNYDYIWSRPTVNDVNGDSKQEVIFGSNDGYVYCLNRTVLLIGATMLQVASNILLLL